MSDRVKVVKDGEGGYFGTDPSTRGAMASGKTHTEVIDRLQAAVMILKKLGQPK